MSADPSIVLIRGAGDLATGVAARLHRVGFYLILTEVPQPRAVRRLVALAEAVYAKEFQIEDLHGCLVENAQGAIKALASGKLPILVDPEASIREEFDLIAMVDARMRKCPPEMGMEAASLVIGLGPGFTTGVDCHAVIETNRGHNLGRVIEEGEAEPDSGIPGEIRGYTWERVLRAPGSGRLLANKKIGDPVKKGEQVARVEGAVIEAGIDGVLRGILRDGFSVHQGMKVGDIDPRGTRAHCFTISDKARAVGGGVLEAILMGYGQL